ncbi:hypothetical protein COCNU_scaffold061038G000010 [Cocos nucifera]|nr:hypothetical protein [Cocos nucifera]
MIESRHLGVCLCVMVVLSAGRVLSKRQYHLIRDYLEKGYVEVKRVNSTDNVADPLTKPLGQQKFETHLEKMRLRLVANWL